MGYAIAVLLQNVPETKKGVRVFTELLKRSYSFILYER